MDRETIERWIERAGFSHARGEDGTLRVTAGGTRASASIIPPPPPSTVAAGAPALPPFYVQLSENWVLLSMLPMIAEDALVPPDVNHKLLALNREMRLAKFALDSSGAVVLCAELPTESLDESELVSALDRMSDYARRFEGGARLVTSA